jgi:hypothetical protein
MVKTTKLERLRRRFADEYMATHPGVTRQQAKRIVTPRAREALLVVQINASMRGFVDAVRRMAPAINQAAAGMRALTSTYSEHPRR